MAEMMRRWEMDGIGRNRLELREAPIPKPGRGEVLVKVTAVSLSYVSVGRLLIIDDNPSIGAELGSIGKSCDFATVSTTTAKAFIESYFALQPTVIILDFSVPEIDGIELLKWLGNVRCTATVLIICGLGCAVSKSVEQLGEARGLKMGGTITKPFRASQIRELLTQLSVPGVSVPPYPANGAN